MISIRFQVSNTKELADKLFALSVDRSVFLGDLEYHGALMACMQDALGNKLSWWLKSNDYSERETTGTFTMDYDETKPPLPWMLAAVFEILDIESIKGILVEISHE